VTISKDLFLAILSMDAYNQGYGRGFEHGKTQIGSAVVDIDDDTSEAQSVGFYALSYKIENYGDGLLNPLIICSL